MSIRILTKNGIDNTNIDGARDHNFNAGRRSGIVKGVLNEGKFFIITSNIVCLDSCELRLFGHRIVIEEAITHTLAGTPSTAIRYSFIAQVIVDDNFNVSFSTFIQLSSKELIQDNLDKTGKGTYQLEIGKFTQLSDGTLTDVTRTADLITGGDGSGDSEYIRIGTVTTNKISPELDADVDIENTINPDDNKPQTNFTFNLPTPSGTVVSIAGEEKTSINTDTTPTANSQNLVTSGGVHDYPAISFAESERQKSKNLFPFGNVSGTNQAQRFISLPAGTYTLSATATSSDTDANTCLVGFYNKTTEWIGGGQLTRGTRQSITVSLAQPTTSIIFFASNNQPNSEGDTFTFADIQIEEGSIATAYYPYSGEITHNGDATVVFADAERQKSKNLFDAPSITLPTDVTYNSSTNTFTYTSGEVAEGATAFVSLNRVVLPAGNYVYSFDSTSTITGDTTYIVAKLNSAGAYESQIATKVLPAGKVSIPFTLTEDTYIGLCWYYKTGWSAGSAPAGSKTISNVQLEQGSTATDYQPYYGEIVHQVDIAPVVLYDKSSQNIFFGTAYPVGIPTQTEITSGVDFSPYKKLKVYYTHNEQYFGCADIDLTKQTFGAEGGNGTWCCLSDDGNAICAATFQVKTNSFKCTANGFTKLSPLAYNSRPTGTTANTKYYIYRIEGVK